MVDMLEQVLAVLHGLPAPLVVIVIAATPILELRGSIPLAQGVYGYSWWLAMILSVIGNMIPAFVILYGWGWFISLLERRLPTFHAFMTRYHDRLHAKWQTKIDTYGPWALALFVAVPIPLSGVWSGALIAWIFSMRKRSALLAIFAGVVMAAIIVMTLTTASIHLL